MSPSSSENMLAAYRSAPHIDPAYTAAIGNSAANPGDAAVAAQATAGVGESAISVNALKTMDSNSQRDYWQAADDNTRKMWQSAGYSPPTHHRGFFGSIGHLASDVLNDLGAPLRAVEHGYRALQANNLGVTSVDDNGNAQNLAGSISLQRQEHPNGIIDSLLVNQARHTPGLLGTVSTKLFSPSSWADAWAATNKGERTFDTKRFTDTQNEYNGQTIKLGNNTFDLFDIAQAAATGQASDFAKSHLNGDPQAIGDFQAALSNNSQLKAAITQLNGAKLSYGRTITPDALWSSHPALAAALSGSGDAIFDSTVDPLLVAGKVNKAIKAVRWGIHSNEDIDRIYGLGENANKAGGVTGVLQSGTAAQGQRWLNEVVTGLNSDNPAQVLRKFPSLAGTLPSLANKGIDSPEKLVEAMKLPIGGATPENVGQWIKDNHAAARVLVGDGTPAGKDMILAPHLSWTSQQLVNAKDLTAQGIDWAKNVTIPDVNFVGSAPINAVGKVAGTTLNLLGGTAKKVTTLIPEGTKFDPNSVKATTFVQRFLDTYLTRDASDKVMSDWINAGYDTATKRNVYSDMLDQVFNAAGMQNSAEGRMLKSRWVSDTEKANLLQKYAPLGFDKMVDDGQTVSHGVTESQITQEWSLPSFRELAAAANRTGFNKIVYGVSNNFLADSFNALWKPAQLLRFGFPIRVSLDELTGGLLRNGVWSTVQARLSKPVAETLGEYAKELDPTHVKLAAQDGNALGIFAANLSQRVKRSAALGVKPLLSKDIYDGIKWGLDNGSLDKGLPEEISAAHGGSYLKGDPESKLDLLRSGIKSVPVYFANGDDYRVYERGNDNFNRIWKWRLGDLAQSSAAKVVLQGYKDGLAPENIVRKVADHMQTPEWASYWNRGARSQLLSDGRKVGVDATKDEAALDWANVLEKTVDKTLPAQGIQRTNFISHMLDTETSPELDMLSAIGDIRPEELTGPEQIPIAGGGVSAWLKNFSDHSFRYIGKSIDWMARQPLYLHNYAAAHKELRPIIEASLGKGPATEEVLKQLVEDRAIRATAPFIHNPEIRSQMNEFTRNLLPFQFAQEQFYKRWTRTFVHSPEAIRKAQLGVNAIATTGITHDDGTGNQVFTYPVFGWGQRAIGDVFNLLHVNVLMPVHGGFSGQLKMVAPGLDRTFAPSFGPLVTVPVTTFARYFPELKAGPVDLNVAAGSEKLVGPISSSKAVWEQIVPASLARIIHAKVDQPDTSTSYASAMMKTIQDIASSKVGSKDPEAYQKFMDSLNQDPHAKQQFLDAVKNGTRINVVLRALLGFTAPAAPSMAIGSTKFADQMKSLQADGLTFNDALKQIVNSDPSLTPYATFQSSAAGDEPLPATAATLDSLNKNQAFFIKNPAAGGFFLPDGPSSSEFNSEAYRLQTTYEMRKRKTPEQFLDQLLYNEAANTYFKNRDDYNAATKNMHGAVKSSAANKWAQWKGQFMSDHPVFSDMLQSSQSLIKRQDTLRALQQAFDDPDLPKGQRTDVIGKLLGTYVGYQQQMQVLAGRSDGAATNARKALTSTMTNYAHGFVADNPDAKSMYQTLIKPDLEGTA